MLLFLFSLSNPFVAVIVDIVDTTEYYKSSQTKGKTKWNHNQPNQTFI